MNLTALQPHVRASDVPPEQLAHNQALTEQEKIGEASRQFEAILLRQILEAAQKNVIPSKFADTSTAGSIYRDMVTNQLADSMSKSGAFGLAGAFEHQLTRPAAAAAGAPSDAAASQDPAPALGPPRTNQKTAPSPSGHSRRHGVGAGGPHLRGHFQPNQIES